MLKSLSVSPLSGSLLALLSCLSLAACQTSQPNAGSPPASATPQSSPVPSVLPTPAASASVSRPLHLMGQLSDYPFDSVSGLNLVARPTDGSAAVSTRSDAQGRFALDLPSGDAVLQVTYASGDSYRYTVSGIDIASGQALLISRPKGLSLGAASSTTSLISGFLTSSDGRTLLRNLTLEVRSLDARHPFAATVHSNDCDSAFMIGGLPPGVPLELTASFLNYQPITRQVQAPAAGERSSVTLGPDTPLPELLSHLNPALAPLLDEPGAARSVVAFGGLATHTVFDADLRAESLDPQIPFSATSPLSEGRFQLLLPAGVPLKLTTRFDGRAVLPGFDGQLERSFYYLAEGPWPPEHTGRVQAEIQPGRLSFDTSLAPASNYPTACDIGGGYREVDVTGRLSDGLDHPLSGATVRLRSLDEPLTDSGSPSYYEATATLGPSGSFVFPAVIAGRRFEISARFGSRSLKQTIQTQSNLQNDPGLNHYALALP